MMNYADLDALAMARHNCHLSQVRWLLDSQIVKESPSCVGDSPPPSDLERAAAGLVRSNSGGDRGATRRCAEPALAGAARRPRLVQPPAHRGHVDDPIKVEQPGKDRSQNLMPQLRPQFDAARESVLLVSPYFVPRKGGVEFLRALRARGVRVRVLTNGLASTDVVSVFGSTEVPPSAARSGCRALRNRSRARPRRTGQPAALGGRREGDGRESAARGAARQVLSFDCLQFFVGSMNLDPRSAFTNTEIGFLVDAPDVAGPLCEGLDESFARVRSASS